jgi:cell division protein FtsB
MRVFGIALVLVLAALQYRLWVSDDGVGSVITLKASVKAQTAENEALVRRNDELVAEVKDLKEGLAALEERARNDLGMIGPGESFFQVVEGEPRGSLAPAPGPEPLPIQRTSH